MNKEEITVSAEVKTYLMDLYNQIEYELQEQYNDEVQKLQQENQELKHILDELEKWAKEEMETGVHLTYECDLDFEDVLNKIKELRGKDE